MLVLFGVQALLKFGNTYLLGNAGEKIVADLKIRVYDHLQALPLSFFHQRRQGDTLALLTRDVYVVSGYISGTALAIVPLLFTVAGAVFFMFRLRARAGAAGGVPHPAVLSAAEDLRPPHPAAGARSCSEEHATAIAIAEENLGMLPAIKTFTREQQESARHREQVDRIRRADRAAVAGSRPHWGPPSSSSPRPASCWCCGSPAARSPAASSPRPSW